MHTDSKASRVLTRDGARRTNQESTRPRHEQESGAIRGRSNGNDRYEQNQTPLMVAISLVILVLASRSSLPG